MVARTLELGYLTEEEAATVAEVGYSPVTPLLWVLPLLDTKLDNDVQLSKATDLVGTTVVVVAFVGVLHVSKEDWGRNRLCFLLLLCLLSVLRIICSFL